MFPNAVVSELLCSEQVHCVGQAGPWEGVNAMKSAWRRESGLGQIVKVCILLWKTLHCIFSQGCVWKSRHNGRITFYEWTLYDSPWRPLVMSSSAFPLLDILIKLLFQNKKSDLKMRNLTPFLQSALSLACESPWKKTVGDKGFHITMKGKCKSIENISQLVKDTKLDFQFPLMRSHLKGVGRWLHRELIQPS